MRLVALLVLASACGGAASSTRPTTPKPPPKTVELEPLLVEVGDPATGGEVRGYDARNLLDDGNDALIQRRFDEALAAFDNLLRDFPGSKLAVAAQYNAGLALEGKRDWAGAAERFRRVLATGRDPEHREDFVNAHFRLGAVLAEIEQFAESARVLEQVLERTDLPPDHRIEALARLGYALVETKDYAAGEEVLRKAIAYHREVQGTHRLDSTHFVAMAQFYLAMIPHRQFGAVPLRYPEQQMSRDLDQKSQLFLLARDRYIKVVDYKDAQWATAAVYQVAHMYKEFWDAWMAVPIPAELNATEAKEYVRQMNQEPNLKKLLEKSLLFHERNIAMAESVRAATQWSRLSIEEAETVRKIIARQSSGDLVEPGVAPAPAAGPKDSPPAGSRVYFPARREL
jgi:tetratricopeptide (TPR) repeat protein